MKIIPSYYELIKKNLLNDPVWLSYLDGKGSAPNISGNLLRPWVSYFYYLGDFGHAEELSDNVSIFFAQRAKYRFANNHSSLGVSDLFEGALYLSLAQKVEDAKELWKEVVEKRRKIPENLLFEENMSHLLIYEAYSLERLARYNEVSEPALKGLHGINKGKTIYDNPRQNSRVYRLTDVLIRLANHNVQMNSVSQKEAQEALIFYKNENRRYGRLGYDIIFDLQTSYPDIFEPVLPGSDPEQD